MKLSQKKQPKNSKKYQHLKTQQQIRLVTRYRGSHHEMHLDDDEELGIVLIILGVVTGFWWGIVHVIDIWFNNCIKNS